MKNEMKITTEQSYEAFGYKSPFRHSDPGITKLLQAHTLLSEAVDLFEDDPYWRGCIEILEELSDIILVKVQNQYALNEAKTNPPRTSS
jgi:hypothetical protein